MYLTRVDQDGPHHYGPCPYEGKEGYPQTHMDNCHASWLKGFGEDCSLCGKRFIIGWEVVGGVIDMGNAAVYSKDDGSGEHLAIACHECCPSRRIAKELHNRKPWWLWLITRPDYKDENYDKLLKIAEDVLYLREQLVTRAHNRVMERMEETFRKLSDHDPLDESPNLVDKYTPTNEPAAANNT